MVAIQNKKIIENYYNEAVIFDTRTVEKDFMNKAS